MSRLRSLPSQHHCFLAVTKQIHLTLRTQQWTWLPSWQAWLVDTRRYLDDGAKVAIPQIKPPDVNVFDYMESLFISSVSRHHLSYVSC